MLTPKQRQTLERARRFRAPSPPDQTIRGAIESMRKDLARQERGVGGASKAWMATVPEDLRQGTALESLSRGVLLVRVSDSAHRYRLDRFLRSGGEAAVVRASAAAIKRIKLAL